MSRSHHHGAHHQHVRQRIHENLEKYPHPHAGVRFLDRFVFLLAFVGPLTTFPQLYEIYVNEQAAGVSVLTWALYMCLAMPWLAYGIVHKETPIIVSNILWIITDIAVIAGVIMYS